MTKIIVIRFNPIAYRGVGGPGAPVAKFIDVIQKPLTFNELNLCEFSSLTISHLLREFQLGNLTRGLLWIIQQVVRKIWRPKT